MIDSSLCTWLFRKLLDSMFDSNRFSKSPHRHVHHSCYRRSSYACHLVECSTGSFHYSHIRSCRLVCDLYAEQRFAVIHYTFSVISKSMIRTPYSLRYEVHVVIIPFLSLKINSTPLCNYKLYRTTSDLYAADI